MSPFHDRRRGADPHLEWKVRLFSVAAVAGLCGIYFDERWMTVGAIAILGAALALRFMPRASDAAAAEADESDAEPGPDDEDRGRPPGAHG